MHGGPRAPWLAGAPFGVAAPPAAPPMASMATFSSPVYLPEEEDKEERERGERKWMGLGFTLPIYMSFGQIWAVHRDGRPWLIGPICLAHEG